jgi:hypothetical protein
MSVILRVDVTTGVPILSASAAHLADRKTEHQGRECCRSAETAADSPLLIVRTAASCNATSVDVASSNAQATVKPATAVSKMLTASRTIAALAASALILIASKAEWREHA